MKLFYSGASPYARKVLAAAHELGLAGQITVVVAAANPVEKEKAINQHNPAGKIPTLVTEKGEAIFDSRVIAEYLDSLAGGGKLIPHGVGRWKTLVLQSLCDEALDACLLMRYEATLRPEALRWAEWSEGQLHKVMTSLDALEADWIHHLAGAFDLGALAAGSLLGYLDFRFGHLDWRSTRPKLAAWYEGASRRPSMEATAPKA